MEIEPRHRQELLAIAFLLAGIFLALTLLPLNVTGPLGRGAGRFLWIYLGIGAALLPLAGFGLALAGFGRIPSFDFQRVGVLVGGLMVLLPFAIAIGTGVRTMADFPANHADWPMAQKLVGIVPAFLVWGVSSLIGTAGAVLLGLLGISVLTIYTVGWHPFERLKSSGEQYTGATASIEDVDEPSLLARVVAVVKEKVGRRGERKARSEWDGAAEWANEPGRPKVPPSRRHASKKGKRERGKGKGKAATVEELPPNDLMVLPGRAVDAGEVELEELGKVLIDTLATFQVEGKIVGRTTGPVVTRYEIAPGSGVKVGRIAALSDDLALAMRAPSIRIVAPIPGKAAVGVEIPNPRARMVTLRELLDSPEWERNRGELPIALGRNLEGKPVVADLAKMPHLLIAGTTGSGKSVCINTLITSLVYRYTPRELRMLMIDPKMVELTMYNTLPHLRHPVVTDNHQAAKTLKWAMMEMERRYALFHANGARNISDFNKNLADGKKLTFPVEKRLKLNGTEQEELPLPYDEGALPYIVVFVDELADLMMTVQSEVEKPLAILAQKARATGIHLILATQRPSVNVLTGLIKANFQSRIAFRVASKVDSRTILDQNGAEALLGNGDMLFLPPGKSEPTRVQGAFISTEETESITEWYRERVAETIELGVETDILEAVRAVEAEEESDDGRRTTDDGVADRDPLFREAAEVCVSNQQGSTSLLQRKLRIGYGRAARIIDQLYEAGILGPSEGSRAREVLIGPGQVEEYTG
ncbi:MAG: DNA translocase FtsK [Gemmatimonadales bacterium]